jgi:LmbE family N-acetylglucosaminyl deacetylase
MTTRPATLDGGLIPAPRPHFRLRDGALYFLISRRPAARLEGDEPAVWDALDGAATLDALRARFGPAADAAVRRFVTAGLCELVPTRLPAGRRRVLVIEPHMDDAVLSVGGVLWQRREECEFVVLSLAGRSNFSSYGYLDRAYFDPDEITRLRLAESTLFVRRLGGRHLALALPEAPQRYRPGDWPLDWYRRHRASISAFIAHRSPDRELAEWTAAVRDALRADPAREVWFPIGVAPHTDHELTRNACFAALLAEPALRAGRVFRLYEEVPYAAQFPRFTAELVAALTRAGARLAPAPVDVTESFAEKLRLVSLFGSQFKLEALRPGIEAAARAAAGTADRFAERLFELVEPPRLLDPLDLYVDAARVRALARRVAPWLVRHRGASRLRILLRAAAGRWREDLDLLLRTFPHAQVEAHAAPPALAEIRETSSDRVVAGAVAEGPVAWLRLCATLALRAPAPTIFIAGPDREREARLLSRAFPFSDTLVAPSLNLVVEAVRLAQTEGRP